MAKKTETSTGVPEPDFVPETGVEGGEPAGFDPATASMDLGDFDVENEYKPSPLAPSGVYHGAITDVKVDNEKRVIRFYSTLNENGGYLSDGETPIDGSVHVANVWLPKDGDENIPSSDGRTNKRQGKINMMKRFADNLKIDMSKPKVIAQSILDKEWLGIAVDVKLKITEYEGIFRNEVDRLVAR